MFQVVRHLFGVASRFFCSRNSDRFPPVPKHRVYLPGQAERQRPANGTYDVSSSCSTRRRRCGAQQGQIRTPPWL
jgi:hypothetical protein